MVAYNFQRGFTQQITRGTKRSTIRPVGRRRHARPGDQVQLYVGQRTAHCRLLAERRCVASSPIAFYLTKRGDLRRVSLGGRRLDAGDVHVLARMDGFESPGAMADWFFTRYGPGWFRGVRIAWGGPR